MQFLPQASHDGQKNPQLLSCCIERFIAELRAWRRSETTLTLYRSELTQMANRTATIAGRELLVAELDEGLVASWLASDPSWAPSTMATKLRIAKVFGHWLVKRRLLERSPAEDIVPPCLPTAPPKALTEDQTARLLERPDVFCGKRWQMARDRAMLELLYAAGLRNAEIRGLDRGDITRGAHPAVRVRGKGAKTRTVPLYSAVLDLIDAWLAIRDRRRMGASNAALFVSVRGARMRAWDLDKIVHRYAEASGVGPVTPHQLRHSYATHLLRHGATPYEVSQLMGHSSVQITMRYLSVTQQQLEGVVASAHPRASGTQHHTDPDPPTARPTRPPTPRDHRSPLHAAYDWIDSGGEWDAALNDPDGYVIDAAHDAAAEGHPEVTATDLLKVIDWYRSRRK